MRLSGYNQGMARRRYAHLKPADQVGMRTRWQLQRDAKDMGWNDLEAMERHWRQQAPGSAIHAALQAERRRRRNAYHRRWWRNASYETKLKRMRAARRYDKRRMSG